jgi:hypothetical protein
MKGYVNGIDWINAEAMKYWSHTSATPAEKRKQEIRNAVFSGDYIGARKVDGYYERLIKDEDGNCFMTARSKNVHGEATEKLAWVPQIHDFMKSLPNGTVLLSECWLPGDEGSKKITSLLGCLKDKCIARQEKGQKLHFYIFDVMAWAGEDFTKTSFIDRVEYLHLISHAYIHNYVEWAQYYEGAQLWDKLQFLLAEGYEGMVIMRKDAPVYFKRTPARVSFKVKKEIAETLDCFFTGKATPPSKDYQGKEVENWQYWVDQDTDERLPIGNHYYEAFMDGKRYIPVTKPYYLHYAGSLEIGLVKPADGRCRITPDSEWVDGLNIVPIGYLSGLTDEIKMNYKDYAGRVIEVGAMELNDTGGLRHAKMLGWREDKTWQECTLDQLKDI